MTEPRSPLPTGSVTFLFTDIEGSTRLWEQHRAAMQAALARHDAVLAEAIEIHRGHVFKRVGDAFCAAFTTAPQALAAALAAQKALTAEPWGVTGPLRVRMALHTGIAEERDADYFGPTLNRVARLLAIGHGGQSLLSLATEQLVHEDLPGGASLRDLGLHRLKDLQRAEQVFQFVHPDLPAEFPPLRSLDTLPNNLPLQLTSFIGRERELEEVQRLLTRTRLLTIAGSGGCGKTRLALQVAADLLEEYADGVWLVDLGALLDPGLVPQAVAAALAVREEAGRPLSDTLLHFLKPRQLLLLLDNCEHLVADCAALVDALLRGCPNLRILATSRETLTVAGELSYRVPSLEVPPAASDPWRREQGAARSAPGPAFPGPSDFNMQTSALLSYPAVRLFIERASFSQPGLRLTAGDAPVLAQICRRLDGIPLAIELAAARVKLLSVEQIAARLDHRFRLLTGGSRTAMPRQQTLRAALDWSYHLLSEAERVLLRRLSVFVGGWTLAAAEVVCAGEGAEEEEILELLGQLVDKSLVMQDVPAEEARYRLLETIREYAGERLQRSGEEPALRGRHRDWYCELAARAEPHLTGAEQSRWLDRLETEHDNLRAALGWAVEGGDAEAALGMATALWRFWHVRGHLREGRERLETALAMPGARARTSARAQALNGAGALAHDHGDLEGAASRHEESLTIARECGDRESSAFALNHLGNVLLDRGNCEQAIALYEEAVALWRQLGNRRGIATSLNNLGSAARDRGEYEKAIPSFEESLALKRELGDQGGMANSLNNLGNAAIRQGQLERAAALLDESLRLFQELGDSYGSAIALNNLATLAFERGDGERATALFQQSLAISVRLENRPAMAESVEGLAGAAAGQGRSLEAARLYGAAEALREAAGAPRPDSERAQYERQVAVARGKSETQAWEAAWTEGRRMTLPELRERCR